MKTTLFDIAFIALVAVIAISCDEGLKPTSRAELTDVLHPDPGKEPLEDAKLGFFYENDYIAPMFNAFLTKEQFDEVAQHERSKFLHVAADSCNTVDIVTALAEYEHMTFEEKLRSRQDMRYQMMYVNTYPSDAKYEAISVESSNPDVVNPIMVDPKSWFVEICSKGNANLTLTVSDGKKVIKHVYPVAVIAEVPLFFGCDNVWFMTGLDVPVQKITFKYAFPRLPKSMSVIDFLATARVKCYRSCEYRNEPDYGNRWFHVEDTVSLDAGMFVESLMAEEEKSFLSIYGSAFDPFWEWDRYYTEYLDTVKNEVVKVLHEDKKPYEIYRVYLYFDGTPFDRHFDMDGSVRETNFMVINQDPRSNAALSDFYNMEYGYVESYYRRMGDLWTPEKTEHNILELFFNEFLTDEQIESLITGLRSNYYSHGWSDYQVDSIFNANYEHIQAYKRNK